MCSGEDVVGSWKEYSEGLLNPTDTHSVEEAEFGDKGDDEPSPEARSLRYLDNFFVAPGVHRVLECSGCCRAVLVDTPLYHITWTSGWYL